MPAEEAAIVLALRGEGRVQAGMEATALSVRGLRNALIEANAEMNATRRRSFLMNQALFTARRLLYAGTLGMIAFTGAVVTMGFKFNMTMENNTVALTQFLGSTQAAQTELNKLYEVAARTPFEFTDIVDATRRFLAFGFSLQETNRYLNIIGDTAAAFGGGADQVQRMVLVFGQMRAAGRVLGQDLLQLEQIGVPALQILQEQLGLTQDQMANIGRLHIPANIAIEALMRGLDQRFHGMSEKQAKTLQGRVSTLHDYAARLFGTLTLPLYNRLRDYAIPSLTSLITDMQKAAKTGGIRGALQVVDLRYGTNIASTLTQIGNVAKNFGLLLKNDLVPILIVLNDHLKPLYVFLLLLGGALSFFAHHATLTKVILILLLIEFARAKAVMLIFGGPGGHGGLLGAMTRGLMSVTHRWRSWKNLIQLTRFAAVSSFSNILGAWQILTTGFVRGANGQFKAMTRLQKEVLRLRTAFVELDFAMLGWIGLALAVVAAIVLLYFKWKPFRDIVNDTVGWLWKHYYILIFLVPVFGVVAAAVIFAVKHFRGIRNVIMSVVHWLIRLVGWLKHAVHWLNKIHIPNPINFAKRAGGFLGLQQGGMVTGGGAFVVGERGPEIAMLPAGAAVSPISATNMPISNFFNTTDGRPIVVEVYLDSKQIYKSTAKRQNDKLARL